MSLLNAEKENIKRALYREWFPKRNQPTQNNPRLTYSQRFAQMQGETLENYHGRLREEAGK